MTDARKEIETGFDLALRSDSELAGVEDTFRFAPKLKSIDIYPAVDSEGCYALIVALDRAEGESKRSTRGLSLIQVPKVSFRSGSSAWDQAAGIITCRDPGLNGAFAALAASLVEKLEAVSNRTSWSNVLQAFEEWERLLQRRRRLSNEEELGLWAEMWIIAESTRPALLVASWRGPEHAPFDFLLDGVGVEVKAARRNLIHNVSQNQLDVALPEFGVLCSIHASLDPVRGESVKSLGARIRSLVDPTSFDLRLLELGLAPDDLSAYEERWVHLRPPLWFSLDEIPRVREADPGVTHIRFQVQLEVDARIQDARLDRVYKLLGLPIAAAQKG